VGRDTVRVSSAGSEKSAVAAGRSTRCARTHLERHGDGEHRAGLGVTAAHDGAVAADEGRPTDAGGPDGRGLLLQGVEG
jgi:hypothetical protein